MAGAIIAPRGAKPPHRNQESLVCYWSASHARRPITQSQGPMNTTGEQTEITTQLTDFRAVRLSDIDPHDPGLARAVKRIVPGHAENGPIPIAMFNSMI
ncbi:hypothetical protein GCM10009539_06400 [Cryptosporangium japonicum]|uniref:FXSXX-COOH protein n=1 Tax=Cryptosporangium japonicum TaxID=80872 RepID=A0ABP3D5H9_9ACTN